jgi:hypothetical protein
MLGQWQKKKKKQQEAEEAKRKKESASANENENESARRTSEYKATQDSPATDAQLDRRLTLEVGCLFGELNTITQKKWRHATVLTLEPSVVIVFNSVQVNRVIKVFPSPPI